MGIYKYKGKKGYLIGGLLGLAIGYVGGYEICLHDSEIVGLGIMDLDRGGRQAVVWEKKDNARRALLRQEDGTCTTVHIHGRQGLQDVLDMLRISDEAGADPLADSLEAQVETFCGEEVLR